MSADEARREFERLVLEVANADGRFAPRAYAVIAGAAFEAIRQAQERGDLIAPPSDLAEVFRVAMREEFGRAARTVVTGWGIETDDDFAEVLRRLETIGVVSLGKHIEEQAEVLSALGGS